MVRISTQNLLDGLAVFTFQWRQETENSSVDSFQCVERGDKKPDRKHRSAFRIPHFVSYWFNIWHFWLFSVLLGALCLLLFNCSRKYCQWLYSRSFVVSREMARFSWSFLGGNFNFLYPVAFLKPRDDTWDPNYFWGQILGSPKSTLRSIYICLFKCNQVGYMDFHSLKQVLGAGKLLRHDRVYDQLLLPASIFCKE